MPSYPCGLVACACPAETATSGHKGCVVLGPLPGGAFLVGGARKEGGGSFPREKAEVRRVRGSVPRLVWRLAPSPREDRDPGPALRLSALCLRGLPVLDTPSDGAPQPLVFCVTFRFAPCTPAHLCTRTPAHPRTGTPAHLRTRTPAHLHTGAPAHPHTGAPARPHLCPPAHPQTCTPAQLHTRTPARPHTRTPARRHTCISAPPFPSLTHIPASEAPSGCSVLQ